jgi:hypothetical protein
LVCSLLLLCSVAENYPIAFVEVLRRFFIGLLNRSIGFFVAENLRDFVDPVPLEIITAVALTPEDEKLFVDCLFDPVL